MIDPDGMEAEDGDGPLWNPWVRVMAFALAHPDIAAAIGTGEKGSSDIPAVATNFSVNSGVNRNIDFGDGSQRNALRHATWQAIISSDFGKGIVFKNR